MIYGIGTDIIATARVERAFERFGTPFVAKILSPREQVDWPAIKQPVQHLASRFAAKEALVKAFGTGMRGGIWFTQFTLTKDESGRPEVQCTGAAQAWVQQHSIADIKLTLSHERDYAVAFALVTQKNSF